MVLRLLADKVVELDYIKQHLMRWYAAFKTKLNLGSTKRVGNSTGAKRQLCCEHGNGVGRLQASDRSRFISCMHGRISKTTDCGDKGSQSLHHQEVAKYDYEYRRCGVCNIFLACEPLAGKRMVKSQKKNQGGLGLFYRRNRRSIRRECRPARIVPSRQNGFVGLANGMPGYLSCHLLFFRFPP